MHNNFEEPIVKELHHIVKDYVGIMNKQIQQKTGLDRHGYLLLLIAENVVVPTQKELAKFMDLDKVTINRMVDHLIQTGFITKEKDGTDKRIQILKPTEKGTLAAPEIRSIIRNLNEVAIKDIPVEQLESFFQTLLTIKSNYKDMPKIPLVYAFSKFNQ